MPTKLFEGTEINTKPVDADRLAFNQAGVAGSKYWTWLKFKNWLDTQISSLFDWIDLTPQNPVPSEQEARFYYNDLNKAYEFYTEVTGLQPFREGRTLRSRVLNNTGVTIAKGKLGKIVGLSGTSPIIELADNSVLDDIKHIVGVAMHDILSGESGYLAVFDTVIGVDTSGMTTNALIYADPENLGDFTNIEPQPPFASYPIGFVSVVDAVNGVIGVRVGGFTGSDTSINSKGILNGIATHTPQVDVSSDGVTITATVTNEEHPLEDLPFILDDVRYLLPTGLSVTVPAGADDETLQGSILYIYLNASIPTLAISTSIPSIPYVRVCEFAVFDAVRTQTDGRPFSYRRSNNAVDAKNGVNDGALGLNIRVLNKIRKSLGSNWLNGQDATPDVNNTTIRTTLSAGNAMQINETGTPAFDGLSYEIYNDITNAVTYQNVNNLTSIIADANGNTLLSNNTYYTIRLFYMLNSNGVGNSVIATRPLGEYSTAAEAIQDPSNFTVNVNDTSIEEIIYPLFDMVIGRTGAGGTTISLIQLKDLRTKILGSVGGGGASGGGGTDDKVRVSENDTTNDYLNNKLAAGRGISLNIKNPSANEQIEIQTIEPYEAFVWEGTLNTTTQNILSLEINRPDRMKFQEDGIINKIKVDIDDLGSNPGGIKINFKVNGLWLLAANHLLTVGTHIFTGLQNNTVSEDDELELWATTGSGNDDIGYMNLYVYNA